MQLGGSRKLTKIKEATIIHKIFDTNFSFSGEIAHYRKNLYVLLFKSFMLVLTKFAI